MHRDDFAMLSNNIVYFDNGATTLKPKCVRDAICKYYDEYTANAHRGDYKTSAIVDNLYESTREEIKNFINAKENSEIVQKFLSQTGILALYAKHKDAYIER